MSKITIRADAASLIAEIHVSAGDCVAAGGLLLTTELMKMRQEIQAEMTCIVEQVHVQQGDSIDIGMVLMTLKPVDSGAGPELPKAQAPRRDYADFRDRIALLQDTARPEAVARRHKKGLRTARENVNDLLDDGSFQEYGGLAVAAMRSTRSLEDLNARTQGDGIITGIGTVSGRPVAVMAVDYMVLAGTQGFNHHRKMDRLIEVARRDALPIVIFAEGGGGRPNDHDVSHIMAAWLNVTSFRHFAAHTGPKIGIVAGYCFAGNAALFGVCDVRIATRNSFIGMGGPAMIEGGGLGQVAPTDIGPSAQQAANGVIDILTDDEAGAVAAARQLLQLNAPAASSPGAGDALRDIVPTDRQLAYDMRSAVTGICDQGSFVETRADFGTGMITGFGRVQGRAVGILANNPLHLGGAIDAPAADKGARHLQLCDRWAIPVVTLCDTPGFMVGPEVEKTGQVAHVSRLFLAGAHFSQPLVTVILRKAYGLGAMAMAGGGFDRPMLCCAWPSGEVGAMGLEGAVKLGARDHLAAITDETERAAEYDRLVAELYMRGKALNAASLLEFDAVIDPADTRTTIAQTLDAAGSVTPGPRYVDAW